MPPQEDLKMIASDNSDEDSKSIISKPQKKNCKANFDSPEVNEDSIPISPKPQKTKKNVRQNLIHLR